MAELAGSAFLSLMVNMDDGTHYIGFSYAILMLMFYELSGGHLNPVVTLGVYLTSKAYYDNLIYLISMWTA